MLINIKNKLLQNSRTKKRIFLIALDTVLLPLILLSSYFALQSSSLLPQATSGIVIVLAVAIAIPIYIRQLQLL